MWKIETNRFLNLTILPDKKPLALNVSNIGAFSSSYDGGCYISLMGESQPPSLHVKESFDEIKQAIEGFHGEP
jgi:hypothetical protein